MIKCRAIRKIKDTNNITIGYVLKDESGKTVNFKSEDIKNHIKNGVLAVDNLKITSDNRLIYSTNKTGNINIKSNSTKYSEVSHLKLINVDKNRVKGYTNYSDIYDFNSPMQAFEYNLPKSYYKGYIKDKKENVYNVEASDIIEDTGRIAGGTHKYYVNIDYNGTIINLSGYSAIFSKGNYEKIIDDLYAGYYLEDYLTKNSGAINYTQRNIVNSITKNNEYNPMSISEQEKVNKENEEKDRLHKAKEEYKSRYQIIKSNSMVIEPNDNRLSNRLKQRNNVMNGGYLKLRNSHNSFAIDKQTNLICIVNKDKCIDETDTARIIMIGVDGIINDKAFNVEGFKEIIGYRPNYDKLDNYLYRFRGELWGLKTFIIDKILKKILCDFRYDIGDNNKMTNTAKGCKYGGAIQYNLRSDIIYFIDNRYERMISLSLNHTNNKITDSNCEVLGLVNYLAKKELCIDNLCSRISCKAYKPHKNTITIWDDGLPDVY